MDKKYILGAIVLLAFLAIGMTMFQGKQEANYEQNFKVGSLVCVYKNNILVEPCKHNLFLETGKNWTRNLIGNWSGGATAMKFIATGNGSTGCLATGLQGETPTAAWDSYRKAGDYTSNNAYIGNWTLSAVYTAQQTINNVNATGLYNASSAGTAFACNNFTPVNLAQNDQLNITWYLWVTEP